jgi:carbonic anhydrase
MRTLKELFERNQAWATEIKRRDPDFFNHLAQQQSPNHMWIGCSDSRVPANQIVDLEPGEMFVHRNVGNVVVYTDLNCLSVMQYAVEALEVEHIIVCGHYGCGGVQAALQEPRLGLIDNWLCHIRDVKRKHADALAALPDEAARLHRLCELNVIEQVGNVCRTTVVQDAWERGQRLSVHGWIYGIADGLLHDLMVAVTSRDELPEIYENAIRPRA